MRGSRHKILPSSLFTFHCLPGEWHQRLFFAERRRRREEGRMPESARSVTIQLFAIPQHKIRQQRGLEIADVCFGRNQQMPRGQEQIRLLFGKEFLYFVKLRFVL
jgi:hypothetical protein